MEYQSRYWRVENSTRGMDFENFLIDKTEIKELYIVGLDAMLCVNETAKGAEKEVTRQQF